jgi:hypothetical protein
MTLDALDRAFVARWEQRLAAAPTGTGTPDAVAPGSNPAVADPLTSQHTEAAVPAEPMVDPDITCDGRTMLDADAGLVQRLLDAGRDQWASLADEVEAARLAGHRVIAVAGGERGEGRTTLVACLASVLRDRGRDVIALRSVITTTTRDGEPADGGRLHDKRIVLVDAGIWFPPGPIRRQRLLLASLGCDAAILVRRADREPAAARATALAATGVTVLGEVVTFAPSAPAESAARGAEMEA